MDLNIHNYDLNDLLTLFKLPFHFKENDLKEAKKIVQRRAIEIRQSFRLSDPLPEAEKLPAFARYARQGYQPQAYVRLEAPCH